MISLNNHHHTSYGTSSLRGSSFLHNGREIDNVVQNCCYRVLFRVSFSFDHEYPIYLRKLMYKLLDRPIWKGCYSFISRFPSLMTMNTAYIFKKTVLKTTTIQSTNMNVQLISTLLYIYVLKKNTWAISAVLDIHIFYVFQLFQLAI